MTADIGRIFPFNYLFRPDPDRVEEPITHIKEQETGIERLKKMFAVDEYGYRSKEFNLITQGCTTVVFISGICGGIVESREAYIRFLETNDATKFLNQHEAKRELQRIMYVSFSKGAARWAFRIGAFSFTYMSMMTAMQVYRGREGIVEYLTAGGITGALFKMNTGLKGTIAGAGLGASLGTIAGAVSLMVLKLGGTSMDEVRNFSKSISDIRQTLA